MSPSLLILKNKINRWELGHSIDKIPQLIHSNTQPSELEPGLLDKTSGQFHAFLDLSKRHRYTTFIMEIIYKFIKSFNVALFFLFLCGIYKRKYIAYTKSDAMIFIWFSVMFLALFLYLTKVYYISTRHGLLMVIPVLAWAGVGFFEIRERMRGWLSDVKLLQNHPRLDTVLLFVLILIVLVPQTVSSYRSDKVELKKAGIVLKNMGFSQSVFIVQPSLSRVAFYADAEPVQLPKEIDYDRIRAFTSKNHAALFIIDDRTVDDFAPGLKKIIAQCMFKKLAIPEMEQYREYSFSIYQVK